MGENFPFVQRRVGDEAAAKNGHHEGSGKEN